MSLLHTILNFHNVIKPHVSTCILGMTLKSTGCTIFDSPSCIRVVFSRTNLRFVDSAAFVKLIRNRFLENCNTDLSLLVCLLDLHCPAHCVNDSDCVCIIHIMLTVFQIKVIITRQVPSYLLEKYPQCSSFVYEIKLPFQIWTSSSRS